MKDILFSQVGFWSTFTILFMFAFMGYFLYKMIKLSGDKSKNYPVDDDSKN